MPDEPVVDEKEQKLKKLVRGVLEEVASERAEAKKKKQKHWTDDLFD